MINIDENICYRIISHLNSKFFKVKYLRENYKIECRVIAHYSIFEKIFAFNVEPSYYTIHYLLIWGGHGTYFKSDYPEVDNNWYQVKSINRFNLNIYSTPQNFCTLDEAIKFIETNLVDSKYDYNLMKKERKLRKKHMLKIIR